jgi:hypothetical protein
VKPPSPDYRIGDVEPVPDDADMDQARTVMRMRGHLQKQAKRKGRNEVRHRAQNILAALAENERRAADPTEQAKTFLRRRGFRPVCKVGPGDWQVGRHHFASEREVRDFARSKGWKP